MTQRLTSVQRLMLTAREHQQPDDDRQSRNQKGKAAALPHGKGVACPNQDRNSELVRTQGSRFTMRGTRRNLGSEFAMR